MSAEQLPANIRAALQKSAHFCVWIPNTVSALVTISATLEMPAGSALIMVFRDTDPADLQPDHLNGDFYLVEN